MNECIFFLHVALILLFTVLSLRLGKLGLGTWICIQALLANLFVLKQVVLFGFDVTCSDVFAIGGILSLNLLQEYYGAESAKKTVIHCFYFMLFFAVLSQIHLLYTPSERDLTQGAYDLLLAPSPRLLFASLATFFIVQKIDIRLFSKVKEKMPSCSFSVRLLFSLLSSQLLDTILFSVLGLYGLVHSLVDMIVLSFLIKALVIAAAFPFTYVSKKWIQPKELIS